MKKIFYILISILFLSCNGIATNEKKNFGTVNISTNIIIPSNSQNGHQFVCKDSIADFDDGYSKIELDKEHIKILNSKNDGYESTQIEIEIDKNSNINSVKYAHNDDTEDGSKTTYEVVEAAINFNKNPFEENSKQVIVLYSLKIKEITVPAEFWKLKNERNYFFKGKIDCK